MADRERDLSTTSGRAQGLTRLTTGGLGRAHTGENDFDRGANRVFTGNHDPQKLDKIISVPADLRRALAS